MNPLDGLVELAGVAEQDEAPRCLADGEGVREAHLSRLVDDEHVHRVGHLLTRPQPRGAAGEVGVAGGECLGHLRRWSTAWTMRSSGHPSPAFAFWIPRTLDRRLSRTGLPSDSPPVRPFSTNGPSAASHTAASRLEITLWLLAVTPTRFPSASRSRIIRAPV